MAIFNPPSSPKKDATPTPPASALPREPDPRTEIAFGPPVATPPGPAASPAATARAAEPAAKESLIAADLTIEGRIQGAGHVRIAGRFKGDITVDGDLTIEVGAKVDGGVRARRVTVAGELEGNVESAQRVELLETGVIAGDVKAGTVVVASGARMRGHVEFGWEDGAPARPEHGSRE